MSKVSSTSGNVENFRGKYVFRSRTGLLYDIPQDALAEKLSKSGQVCVLIIEENNADDKFRFGFIKEVIGEKGDPIPEGKAIASSHNLNHVRVGSVKEALKEIPKVVRNSDMKNYRDLRDVPFITIDPDGAKDFDDAVYGKRNADGTYTLRVAIADVSHYVEKDSPVYNDALEVGNSTYLGSTVYPMLPEVLSNGICSLNEGVDRLTMCTTATMASNGKLLNYTIEPAVIHSNNRLTYKEADYLYFGKNAEGDDLDHTDVVNKVSSDVMESLSALYDISQILKKARMDRGAISIPSRELEFRLDDSNTKVEKIELAHNEKFTSVIEETAVLVNEIWGDIAERYHLPFIFRNLDPIDPNKIPILNGDLKQFQLKLPKNPSGKSIQTILNSVKGKRIEDYVSRLLIRSFRHAFYSKENYGHVALAVKPPRTFKNYAEKVSYDEINKGGIESARDRYFKSTGKSNGLEFIGDITHSAYGHTTSPIRRGADTVNQIGMKSILESGNKAYKPIELDAICENLNMCEKNSEIAEREYDQMLCALWAKDHIGMVFDKCLIVDLNEFSAIVSSPEGIKLSIDYDDLPNGRKYCKIGREVKNVKIDRVTLYPPRIIASVNLENINYKAEEDLQDTLGE